MTIQKRSQILLMAIFVMMINSARAQQEFTLYHMPVLSQSTYLNLASVPEHKFSISLPVPSVFVGFNNSSLSVKSFVDKDGTVDYQHFVDGLKDKNNYIGMGANIELINIRFKAADNFFSLHSRVVNDFRFLYPKDFLGIGTEGIEDGYSLSGIGVHYSSYVEYGIGFTRAKPDSKWTYGGKLKMLGGIANIQTKKSEIELNVNQGEIYQYDLNTDIEVNVAAGVDGGQVKDLDELGDLDFDELGKVRKLNKGFAIDAGATLQYNDKLSFGAAITNLGFINWKSYAENYQSNVSLSFDGVTIDNLDFSQNLDSLIDNQLDSVLNSYEDIFNDSVDTTRASYRTWLPTTMFLSAHYQLSPKLRATGSVYAEFFKGASLGLVTGLNYSATKRLDLTTTWWWFRKSAANLGIGIVYKPGPVQLYMVLDNILPASFVRISDKETDIDGLLLPYQVKNFNLRIGMNLVFGRIKDESRLPKQGLNKKRHGGKKYLYKPSLK